MKEVQIKSVRKWHGAAFAVALLFTLGLAAAFSAGAGVPNPFPGGSGPWGNAVESGECPDPEEICAEWPDPVDNRVYVCCIPQADVGTFQGFITSCRTFLSSRALN